MIKTVEAVINTDGSIRLLSEIHVTGPRRAFLTVLDECATTPDETAILAETALAADWSRPEEDQAWSFLQSAK